MSEITKLPRGWLELPLSEVIQTQKGKKPKDLGEESATRAIPYINIKAFEHKIVTEYAPEQDAVKCNEHDTLLVWDGARAGLSGNGISGYVGSTLARVRSDLVDSRFLSYYFESIYRLLNTQTKGVGIPHINPTVLFGLPFLLPPEAEQPRIVEKLDELLSELNFGVQELKAAQVKLKHYRQSLLKSAVEGALTRKWRDDNKRHIEETGEELLERILVERKQRWEQEKLAEFKEKGKTPPKNWQDKYTSPKKIMPDGYPRSWFGTDLEALIPPDGTGTKTGPFGSLLKKHEHLKEGIPVIGIENIQKMKFVTGSKIHISLEKAEQLSDYNLRAGDVVISRSGTVGEVCVIPDNLGIARFSTNIMRVRLNSNIIRPKYFCYLFNAAPFILNQVKKLCVGSTRDFLNTKILKSINFIVPSIIEQDYILDFVSAEEDRIDRISTEIKDKIKQLEVQRKNILKSAFSGELVPQDENDEPASLLLEKIKKEREELAKQAKPKRNRQAKKKVEIMDTLLAVLTAEDRWIDAQEAFKKCGIVDGTSIDRVEEIYAELRKLEKSGQIEIERNGSYDQIRFIKQEIKED